MTVHPGMRLALAAVIGANAVALSACKNYNSSVKVLGGGQDDSANPGTLLLLLFDGDKKPITDCTGSFISRSLLMTAAHCFVDYGTKFVEVVSPVGQLRDHPIYSAQFQIHPNYGQSASIPQQLVSDVAVVWFAPNTVTPDLIVTLNDTQPRPGDTVTVSGYGQALQDDNTSAFRKNSGTATIGITPSEYGSALIAIRSALQNNNANNAVTYKGDSGGIVYDSSGRGVAIVHDYFQTPPGALQVSIPPNNKVRSFLTDAPGNGNGAERGLGLNPFNQSPSYYSPSPYNNSPSLTNGNQDIVDRWVNINDPNVKNFIRNMLSQPSPVSSNLDGVGFPVVPLPFDVANPPTSSPQSPGSPSNPSSPSSGSGDRWYDPSNPSRTGNGFPYCSNSAAKAPNSPGWGYENNQSCHFR